MTFEALRGRLDARPRKRVDEAGAGRASVALLLSEGASGLELLLIKRAEHPDDPWSGHMALPGGRSEPGDVDRLATAIRETREETGLVLEPGWALGALDDLRPRSPSLPPIVVRPFLFGVPVRAEVRLGVEAADCLWVPVESLKSSSFRAKVLVRSAELEVDAFRAGPHVVWGITHRIVTQLLELL